jgi:glycosyltransferase involved in cell wall biosynthesis
MSLTVLSVAFWLTPVGPGSVGGAEQVLLQIDHGLVRRGHTSLVIARPESQVAGMLIPAAVPDTRISHDTWFTAHQSIRCAMSYAFSHYAVDIVHMHGMHFSKYLPAQDVPTLITLHLPLNWYREKELRVTRPNTFFHCVSRSQRELFQPGIELLSDIENGVAGDLARTMSHFRKRNFAALLGRICPEKGFDLGLRAAKRAGIGALLAGKVFPFAEHERYFAGRIAPELDAERRYVGPAGMRRKRRLLSAARCVVVPSVVPETSSMVAREALACGTPVVGFARGALPEIIQQGQTGFLVEDEREMPDAIRASIALDPQECRRAAEQFLTSDKMVNRYVATYEQILKASCRSS